MKIKDIINESWQDKFAQVQKDMADMTIEQAQVYIKDRFNVNLKVAKPREVGEANGTKGMFKDNTVYVLRVMKLPPDKKVSEINGFFNTLRHELSHGRQSVGGALKNRPGETEYSADNETAVGFAKYMLHRFESSIQVTDLAVGLSKAGFEYGVVESLSNKVAKKVLAMNKGGADGAVKLFNKINNDKEFMNSITEQVVNEHLDLEAMRRSGVKLYMIVSAFAYIDIGLTLTRRFEDSESVNQVRETFRKYRSKRAFFLKQLAKEYRKAKGYNEQGPSDSQINGDNR